MKLTTQELEDLRAHLTSEGNSEQKTIARFLGIDARKTGVLDAIIKQLDELPEITGVVEAVNKERFYEGVPQPQEIVANPLQAPASEVVREYFLSENGIATPLKVIGEDGGVVYLGR
jgi:hypothetical protein